MFHFESTGMKERMPQFRAVRQEELLLTQPFCFIQVFNCLVGAHPHWGEQSALPSLLILMLILSKNTLTDPPRIIFDQMSEHPIAPTSRQSKLAITYAFISEGYAFLHGVHDVGSNHI